MRNLSTNAKIAAVLLGLAVVVLMMVLTSGCAPVDVQAIYDAKADNERARAAAEWARTAQTQAETAAAAAQAPAREEARTLATVAALVIGLATLAGLGVASVTWAWRRARLVYTDKHGLYPVIIGATPATNLNEPGAQFARIAPHRTPVQVLPPPEVDAIPVIPPVLELDARRLQHIERLLLEPPAGVQDDYAA